MTTLAFPLLPSPFFSMYEARGTVNDEAERKRIRRKRRICFPPPSLCCQKWVPAEIEGREDGGGRDGIIPGRLVATTRL